MINILYRLSDNGYKRTKFDFAPKDICLSMTADIFQAHRIHLFVDLTNLKDETAEWAKNIAVKYKFRAIQFYNGGSSAQSWRYVAEYAKNYLKNNDIVYFLEDDYLHRSDSPALLYQGVRRAHYVSLYDHLDKYIPASLGGNPYIEDDGGEFTKVYRTESSHWKLTNSTTMTFATTLQILKEDWDVWDKYTVGSYPQDMQIFLELRQRGRSLITPIPGASTHCMPEWASPGVDWKQLVKEWKDGKAGVC